MNFHDPDHLPVTTHVGMTLNEYQGKASKNAQFKGLDRLKVLAYVSAGLSGEAGEFLGTIKRVLLGVKSMEIAESDALDELGDTLWYLAMCCKTFGVTLEDVAQMNLDKLASGKAGWQKRGERYEPLPKSG